MKKIIKVVLRISFIFYFLALVVLMFLGHRGGIFSDLSLIEYIKASSNFVPFKTISTYVQAMFDGSMNADIPIKNLGGNLFMFLPMGIYLPFFIKRISKVGIFIISMIVVLFFLETVQIVSRRGSFDVDDFILNMIGALLGYGIWKMKFVQNLLK
ncbi:VanZ family protein [Mesobacillus maritimus]|uniref:VanZ family protein n=1 Tax=Mesobacillus maritimus TaxID=1643336 RepID=UPI00384AAD6D